MIAVSSVSMYQVEVEAKGSNIKTFSDSVWWAITTMSTVGYGDKYPVTEAGKIIATIIVGVFDFLTRFEYSWGMDETRIDSNTVGAGASSTNTIDDLLEPLQVAIILGAEVPVPVGAYGFVLFVEHSLGLNGKILGYFQSEESAERYLANYLLNMKGRSSGPWDYDHGLPDASELVRQKEYLLTHDYKDIIKWFKDDPRSSAQKYRIEKFFVTPETPLALEEE